MKKITRIQLFITLLIVCMVNTAAIAQVNDTLVVEVTPTVIVKISADNLPDLYQSEAATQLIRAFQNEWITVKPQIKKQSSYDITFSQDDWIEVDSLNLSQFFSIKKDVPTDWFNKNRCTLLPKNDLNTCDIENNSLHIIIYFEQLEELEDSSILKTINLALAEVPKPSRFTKNWYFDNKEGELKLIKEEQAVSTNLDQIYIKPGIGGALIKNTGMVNIGFSVGLNLGSRGRILHAIYINDEMNYVFDNNSSFTINNFLGVGYARNFSRNSDKSAWFGLEAAFLTNKSSNFFADDTYRLGFVLPSLDKVNVKPFLYFEDGFQKVYPGIGISIDF